MPAVSPIAPPQLADCNCLALRCAGRAVTQFYDRHLAPSGLRSTQYSILAALRQGGPMAIHTLAAMLQMDRTTLGRNVLPLQRDGLVELAPVDADRRRKNLRLSPLGTKRLRAAQPAWHAAQQAFETRYGADRARALRELLRAVALDTTVS